MPNAILDPTGRAHAPKAPSPGLTLAARPPDLSRYGEACDVVITGVGDCGSCSASAVADGIGFEPSR